jgi:hypothetical protein
MKFMFDPQRDNVPNKPYHEDGNIQYYSVKERKARRALKSDPVVKEAINGFMNLFSQSGPPSNRVVQKDEYIRIFTKIAEALYHGSQRDPDELAKWVKDDFESDS